jgi:glycosyltransferase involved in cell wall biosynthesis
MSAVQARIAVLMPTYNGAAFLPEQIESLLAQTYTDLIIVTRDDGSSDDSVAIVARYAASFPSRFHIIESDGRNLGASGSFAFLLAHALREQAQLGMHSAYLMLCDQDDVWHVDKVQRSIEAMLQLEQAHPDTPVLVHSDLAVVDEHRQQIAPSFVVYQGLQPQRNAFGRMLVSNTVTGCTALLNEALVRRALPIPATAIMHDWWLALVASAFGRIGYIDAALLEYRQHGKNTVGAKEYRQPEGGRQFLQRLLDAQHNVILDQIAQQARAFRFLHGKTLSWRQRAALLLAGSFLSSRSIVLRKLTLKLFHRL